MFFYYVIIIRGDKTFYVVSPEYNVYALSETKKLVNLWNSQKSCEQDKRWQHLIQTGDKIEYKLLNSELWP